MIGNTTIDNIIYTPWIDSSTSTANDHGITTISDFNWISWPQPLSIEEDCGQQCIVLRNAKADVVGRVFLGAPEVSDLEFFGNSTEATKIFMTAIRNATNDYLKKQHTAMVQQIISDIEKAEKSVSHFNGERAGAIDTILHTIKSYIAGLKLAI